MFSKLFFLGIELRNTKFFVTWARFPTLALHCRFLASSTPWSTLLNKAAPLATKHRARTAQVAFYQAGWQINFLAYEKRIMQTPSALPLCLALEKQWSHTAQWKCFSKSDVQMPLPASRRRLCPRSQSSAFELPAAQLCFSFTPMSFLSFPTCKMCIITLPCSRDCFAANHCTEGIRHFKRQIYRSGSFLSIFSLKNSVQVKIVDSYSSGADKI